jgi:flagellar protein FlbD
MIELLRLNNRPFLLNTMLIEQIESFPDTTITLLNGKKIVVLDSLEDVKLKINQFYQSVGLLSMSKVQDLGGA